MTLNSLSAILVVMWLSCVRFLWPFPWLVSFDGAAELVFDFIVWVGVLVLIFAGIRASFRMRKTITWALFFQLILVSLLYLGFRVLFDSSVYIALLDGILRDDVPVMFNFFARLSRLAKIDTVYFDFVIPFVFIFAIGVYAKALSDQNKPK